MKKGSKSFYAALGISAVMIGSACYFAYDQGEKISEDHLAKNNTVIREAAVDNKLDDIPKVTSPAYRVTTPPVTTSLPPVTTVIVTTLPPLTLPAVDIVEAEPPAEAVDAPVSETTEAAVQGKAAHLENVKPPLKEMGDILEAFSGSELVRSKTTGSWQTHNGCDISAEVGADVYAISSGEVAEVSDDPLWGVCVTINHHNGFVSKYCGLGAQLSVQQGDTLSSGDLIGAVGETADIESAEAPHLHIELKYDGKFLDPLSEINS